MAGYVVHSHPKEADLPALLAELCDAGIEFIIVGGAAAVLQGAPISTNDRDLDLVWLAQHGCDPDAWKPLMLWHVTRDEFLVRDFLLHWRFPAYDAGTFRVHTDDLISFLHGIRVRGAKTEHAWSEQTLKRVAAGLLKLVVDFGLLRGSVAKEFASYPLPEAAFLYLLHAMLEDAKSPAKVISSPEWRMFLTSPAVKPALKSLLEAPGGSGAGKKTKKGNASA